MSSERAQKLLSKLVLRLDDGTLIKAAGGEGAEGGAAPAATVLRPADAYSQGNLTEAHLLKAQALLCEIHAKLPEEGPLRSLSLGSKRSTDTGFHGEVRSRHRCRRRRPRPPCAARASDARGMLSKASGSPPGHFGAQGRARQGPLMRASSWAAACPLLGPGPAGWSHRICQALALDGRPVREWHGCGEVGRAVAVVFLAVCHMFLVC